MTPLKSHEVMGTLRRVSSMSHYALPGALFVLWLINLSIFMIHVRDTKRRNLLYQAGQKNDERPIPCPSPYGSNVVDNIRRVLGRAPHPSYTKDYLKLLGIDPLSNTLRGKSTRQSKGLPKIKTWSFSRRQKIKQAGWNSGTAVTRSSPVIVLAASSNHFLEVQALLHNLHTVVNSDGHLKVVFFDLGLAAAEHELMVRHCRCDVRYFQFSKFPAHVRDLTIFSWKPIVIQQALQEFGFVMYMDASIRLLTGDIQELLDSARHQGILVIPGDQASYMVVEHTDPRTFAFLGEKPCYFEGIPERQAGFLLMTINTIIQNVIMAPWLECALSLECIAPQGSKEKWFCSLYRHFYGECHRFDQSVFNIVLSRIFFNDTVPTISRKFYTIDRINKMDYFGNL